MSSRRREPPPSTTASLLHGRRPYMTKDGVAALGDLMGGGAPALPGGVPAGMDMASLMGMPGAGGGKPPSKAQRQAAKDKRKKQKKARKKNRKR